jgi:molybdopterin synthase sulfur carrier subunit
VATVWVPSLMRDLTGGADRVDVPGSTVRQVIESLEAAYPGIKERLVEDDRLKPSIGVAVDGVVSRLGLRQPVGETSEVHFLPAVSGGTRAVSGGTRAVSGGTRAVSGMAPA